MKGYLNKIISVTLVIIAFAVSFNTKLDFNLEKTFRTIANSEKRADSCTTGSGEVYYVTTDLSIRSGAGTDNVAIGSLSKCTQVKVYCTSNGWSRISKVSNKWVPSKYLSLSSTACSDISTTTTDRISFGNVGVRYQAYGTNADDKNQMYRDKPGIIIMTLNNINNVAADDQNNINVIVTNPSGVNVTNDFDILRTGVSNTNNGSVTFTLKMKAGLTYDEGRYSVSFSYGSGNATGYFSLVGKYYGFTITGNKTDGFDGNPSNRVNTWQIAINDVEPASAIASDFIVKIIDDKGIERNNNFVITKANRLVTIKNKSSWLSKPNAGSYQVVITYSNPSYTTARRGYKQVYNFEIGSRYIEFKEKSNLRTSYRYTRYEEYVPYEAKIISKTSNTITIKEKENGVYVQQVMSLDDFVKTYADFDSSLVTFWNNKPVIPFNAIKIISYQNNLYTYYDGAEYKTANLSDLEKLYPGVTKAIQVVDELSGISRFTFDSDGSVEYNIKGTKTLRLKYLQDKNKPVLSVVGGQFNFVINYGYLAEKDKKVKPVITRDDGKIMTEADGFRILRQEYDPASTEETNDNQLHLTIEYDNTSEEYTGGYTVSFQFEDVKEKFQFQFSMLDGEMDYYLQSVVDGHLTDPKDAYTGIPPGNKRYEYYLGFYMMKSGLLMDHKTSNSMTYKVYTEQADCSDNSTFATCEETLYFFRQKDYIVTILNYKDGIITFDLTIDDVEHKNVSMPIEEFATKYSEVYELFDYYTFDETTGNINGNSFDIKVLKTYTDMEEGKTYVDYIDKSGTKVTKQLITDFSKKYPEYYGYIVLRYVTNADDEVINGRLRGSLRELNDEEGNSIRGKDITDEFDFTIDPNEYNVDRTLTVLPKVEVPAGTYYVYVGFEGALGVGYLNNSEDPVISKDIYPEMWNRNIHMTTISYSDPIYDAEIKKPIITNVGDNTESIYSNIDGQAVFDIEPKYIYNYDGFSYRIERKKGDTWEDVTTALFNSTSIFSSESSKITVNNIPGTTPAGDYRLVLLYNNNGFSLKEDRTYEFTVKPKYYGIVFEPSDKIVFAKNYSETKNINATGHYITNPNNIELSILRRIDASNAEELVWDKDNKQFTSDGNVIFKYEIIANPNPENSDILDYTIYLTNVKNSAKESEYELIATYKEGDYLNSSATLVFEVSGNKYLYEVGKEERPRVDDTGYIIERDAYIAFVNKESLDDINYTIYYWDKDQRKYIDVSSKNSDRRMFTVTDGIPQLYNENYNDETYEYKVLLTIAVNTDLAPMEEHGDFLIKIEYDNFEREFKFSSLDELFKWSADLKISGDFSDGDKTTKVDKFYLNVDNVLLDVNIDTPHEDIAKYIITQQCLDGVCTPSLELNYNNRFNLIKNEKDHLTLEYRHDLTEIEKLKKGSYALVVYYNDYDKKIIPFDIETEFVSINFDDVLMYSNITIDKTVPNLFKNKIGHIQIPVSIIGTNYNKAIVSITDRNGNGDYSHAFTYNASKFIDEHILDIIYNPNSNINSGEYNIMVYYENADNKIISDNVLVTLNKSYFNFELGEPTYSPNPPVANADPNGEIKYHIETEDIPNLIYPSDGVEAHAEKNTFAKNTIITNTNNVDVTSFFDIEAISTSSPIGFDLSLKYLKNKVLPGTYKVSVSYRLHDYTVTKDSYFTIVDYEKNITIKNVEVITSTDDERVHNNIGGIFKVNYESIYDIAVSDIAVNVINSDNINVTNEFDIVKYENYINVGFNPKTPPIQHGNYTINIIYTDPNTGKVSNHSVDVKIYGHYKKILISNIVASSSTIYADLENQYYNFDLDLDNISSEELSKMQVRAYDSYDNIVYSSIASDKVTNIFDIVKNDATSGQYRINILAFKAPVGEYQVQLLLPNEDDNYNLSNKLTFTIDKTKYQVRLNPDSKVTPSNIYNNDASSFYDVDKAIVDYKFTSNYDYNDAAYSIKVLKNGQLVKEITDINLGSQEEWGMSYLTSKLEIDSLSSGEYDIDICLKGLPYDGISIKVNKYIPITNFDVTVNNAIVTGDLSTAVGTNTNFNYYIEPSDATNKVINISSSDESIFKVTDKSIIPMSKGSAKLIFDHRDFHKEITVMVSDRLTSDQYIIDYAEKTIFVNNLKTTSFTRKMLIDHLIGLSNDYQVLNKNNKVITANDALVGTNYKVISGGENYTVIVIGDLNGDGSIGFGDVSYLYDIYTGYTTANETIKKAGRIRKTNDITFGDVNKLFDFYRGIINEI